jgi:hypothetical protein
VAVLFGRGVAPALPGTRAGIDVWITRFETGSSNFPALAAWLTQLTLVSGVWLSGLLLQRIVSSKSGTSFARLVITLITPALLMLVGLLNVARDQLGGAWLLGMATSSVLLAATCAIEALRSETTRAAGLVLFLVCFAGLTNTVAKVLALTASTQARALDFTVAQVLATGGFALDAVATLVALGWFLVKPTRGRIIATAVLLASTLYLVFVAFKGTLDGPWWQVLVARTLDELTTHPDPLVLLPIRNFFELLSFGTAVCVLLKPGALTIASAAIALMLTSRASIDMPLSALILATGALLVTLPAMVRRALRAPGDVT